MKLNNLDVNAISPRNGDKYSPKLHRFLTNKQKKIMALYGMVYSDTNGVLWIGYKDDEGWFVGTRIMSVLCNGRKAETFAYPKKADELTEISDFWEKYIAFGRCAIDAKHEMNFIGDNGRWLVDVDIRSCRWCGQVRQRLHRYIAEIPKERWVAA